SAGGLGPDAMNPRVYLDLAAGARVAVTDRSAGASTAWDLALKRPVLFTNSGDGGPGKGGAVYLDKPFAQVTTAAASGMFFPPERFFDADCNPLLDAMNAVKTSFDGWYDYDVASHKVTPAMGTWLVKGATGKLYKVQFVSYYATRDGGEGMAGGRYL